MSRFTRRQLLGAGLAVATAPTWASTEKKESLDSLARAKGLRFGTALSGRGLNDLAYLQLVREECGVIVPENEMKMAFIQPRPGEFRFERGDRLMSFAAENKMLVRGHTLLWHHPRWMPRWFEGHDFGAEPARAGEALLREHIRRTSTHFGKQVYSWDVVNEAIHNITGEMRDTRLSKAVGSPDTVLEIAFHAAREHLPDTELVYNDYMGWESDNEPHRNGVLRLLERLRKKNVPVDALGIQAHIGAGNQDSNANRAFDARDEKAWHAFLKEVTGMGHKLLITEFDVHDAPLSADITARDAQVAALGRGFLDVTLSFPEVSVLMCWGLADNYTWLQGRTPRSDGLPKRTSPYDKSYASKPLREEIAASLLATPMRTSLPHFKAP
jgi:endo-1,4-beta-xylanase